MSHRFNKGGYVGGRDLLLLVIIVLLIFQNPPVPKTVAESSKMPGQMSISAAWPEGHVDVDLWVQGPGDRPVGYSNRAGKIFNLLRDDIGDSEKTPTNYENVYSRGLPAGEYIINLHCYSRCRNPETVGVEIRFGQADSMKLLAEEVVQLAPTQERTVLRFRLDGKGSVVPGSVNRVFFPLRAAKQ
jgi:hypothetical protein